MLDKDDITDVLEAYKLVLGRSQDSLGRLELLAAGGSLSPSQCLDVVCKQVQRTSDKIQRISEQCRRLGEVPSAIADTLSKEYSSEDTADQRKLMESASPRND